MSPGQAHMSPAIPDKALVLQVKLTWMISVSPPATKYHQTTQKNFPVQFYPTHPQNQEKKQK
jgi:hypothetical protein